VANIEKRYSIQVAAYNLVLRHLFGAGTPRQAMAAFWFVINVSHGRDLALIARLAPPNAIPETSVEAATVVFVCLLISST
jgi:hypothetical protein